MACGASSRPRLAPMHRAWRHRSLGSPLVEARARCAAASPPARRSQELSGGGCRPVPEPMPASPRLIAGLSSSASAGPIGCTSGLRLGTWRFGFRGFAGFFGSVGILRHAGEYGMSRPARKGQTAARDACTVVDVSRCQQADSEPSRYAVSGAVEGLTISRWIPPQRVQRMVQYSAPARPGMMRRTASEALQSGQFDSTGVACRVCSGRGREMRPAGSASLAPMDSRTAA